MASYEIVFKTKAELEGAQAMIAATDKEIGKLKALQAAGVATEKQLEKLGALQKQQAGMNAALPNILPPDPDPHTNPVDKKGLLKSIKALKHELHGVPGLWEAATLLKGGAAAGLIGAVVGVSKMIAAIQEAKENLKEWKEIQESFKPFDEKKIGGDKIKIASEFASKAFAHEMDVMQRKVYETANTLEKKLSEIESNLSRFKQLNESKLQSDVAEAEADAARRGVKVTPAQRRKMEQDSRQKAIDKEKQTLALKEKTTAKEIFNDITGQFAAGKDLASAQNEIDSIAKQQEQLKESPAKKEYERWLKTAGLSESQYEKKRKEKRIPPRLTGSPYDSLRLEAFNRENKELENVEIARRGADQEATRQARLEQLKTAAEKKRSDAQSKIADLQSRSASATVKLADELKNDAFISKQLDAVEAFKRKQESASTSKEGGESATTAFSGSKNAIDVANLLQNINANITGMRQDWRHQ